MSGIVGKFYFNEEKIIFEKEIKEMLNALSHRGLNDEGIFINRNIGLGHRRLSLINPAPAGHRPIADDEEKIWIVYDGEIYNFLELKENLEKEGIKFKSSQTDTEVIIYLYKKYGLNCLKYLRGVFAFAIWDSQKRELFLARDRIGRRPLKYYYDNRCFIFASELKSILKNPEVKKEPDFGAIDEYFTYQYVPSPKTGFKNIFKLQSAHYLIVKEDGQVINQRYWQLNYLKKLDLSEKEWEKLISDKLKESLKLSLVSKETPGVHLSGGIDSSLIFAFLAQEINEPIKTFSIGFKEKDYNELPYAELVAKKYKSEHKKFIIGPDIIKILPKIVYFYEEPYADSSALPTWHLSEMTKKFVPVVLNGDGGDENFAGYNRYNGMKLFRQFKIVPFKNQLKKINQFLYQILKINLFQKGYRFLSSYSKGSLDFYLRLIDCFGEEEKDFIYNEEFKKQIQNSRWHSFLEEKFNEAKDFDWLDQILYLDINSYLPDDLLVKVDIASMAHNLEIRSPFLDHEFLELTAKMPSNLKFRGYNKKYLLKKIASSYLPWQCINKPKQGFALPLEHWFRRDLERYLIENLLNKKFLDYGFKKEGIEKLISEHKIYHQNYTPYLWVLLTLSHWFKIWFET